MAIQVKKQEGNTVSNVTYDNPFKTPREQVIADILAELRINGQASIKGFGKFTVVEKAARLGRNPRTGEQVQIPEKRVVKFTPAKALKEAF